MANTNTAEHAEGHAGGGTKEIWRVFWILLILTVAELALGFWAMGMPLNALHYALKGAIIILMLAKAFYIVAYFMHLKHEVKNLIMTVVVPMFLFIWFIIAFLYEGNSYKDLKNTYDPYHKEQSTKPGVKKDHENGGKQAPDAQKEGGLH